MIRHSGLLIGHTPELRLSRVIEALTIMFYGIKQAKIS